MYGTHLTLVDYDPSRFKLKSASNLDTMEAFSAQVSGSSREPDEILVEESPDSEDLSDDELKRQNKLRDERQQLLREAQQISKKDEKKNRRWFVSWFIIFGLTMGGIVALAAERDVNKAVKEVMEQGKEHYSADWEKSKGVEKCRKLAEQELMFHDELTNDNLSSRAIKSPSVFIVRSDDDMTFEESCSIESFAHLLAELVVYAVRLECRHGDSDLRRSRNRYKSILAENYKNLATVSVDGKTYFKNTPLDGKWVCKSDKTPAEQAMMLAVWRWGGMAFRPDVVLTRRSFVNFPVDQIHFSNHYVVSYAPCAVPVHYLMTLLASQHKADAPFHLASVAKTAFDALCCAGICPNVVTDEGGRLCGKPHCPLLLMKNLTEFGQFCPKTVSAREERIRPRL